jgi:ATP synthase protein I
MKRQIDPERKPDGKPSRRGLDRFRHDVKHKILRRLRSQAEGDKSLWFGLGMSGLVGWSVALPTLVGTAIGIWIDTRWPSQYSWTLMLMLLGLIIGCLNAWFWIQKESQDEED